MDRVISRASTAEDSGQFTRRLELALGIEHVARLGYLVHYVSDVIVVRYIDIDLIQRELISGEAVESGFFFPLDLVFQFAH